MKKIVKIGWLVIAFASLGVGVWLVFTEPLAHSKFWVYFVTALLAFLLNFGSDLWKKPEKKPLVKKK